MSDQPNNLNDSEIVRRIVNLPLDDQSREDAVYDLTCEALGEAYREMGGEPSPFQLIAEDYEFAVRYAGDLGGCEIL